MKTALISLLLFSFISLQGQVKKNTRLSLMQGIWLSNSSRDSSITNFKIVKEKNCIEFYESPDSITALFNMMIGFQSIAGSTAEIESIQIDSLKENGPYYTEVVDKKHIENDGSVNTAYCVIASYYECDGQHLAINGNSALYEFDKIAQLPYSAIKKLQRKGKKDGQNYIKEYLGIEVKEINNSNSTVYSSPGKKTDVRLSPGDVVIVLEENGNWLKVDYGQDKPGWINK